MSLTVGQLATLKTELQTDPQSLGYAPYLTTSDWIALATILNFHRDGATPCPVNGVVGTAISVYRSNVKAMEVMGQINAGEWTAAVPSINNWLALLCFLVGGEIDATSANTRNVFTKIFAGMATSLGNIDAAAHRSGGRAEGMFGVNVVLTQQDMQASIIGHY